MKQIEINGLLWDTENLVIQGKKYFTWQEAMEEAAKQGKRLPTREEFQALIDSGWKYDQEKKGMWFADRKLFFPLSGFLYYTSGALSYTGYGSLWSSSPKDDSRSWFLSFTGGAAYMGRSNTMNGFPVRCVVPMPSEKCNLDNDVHGIPCKEQILIDGYYAIHWMDSYIDNTRWELTEGYKASSIKALSVGKVIYQDDDVVAIAPHFIAEDKDSGIPNQSCGTMVIPKKSIINMNRLYEEVY